MIGGGKDFAINVNIHYLVVKPPEVPGMLELKRGQLWEAASATPTSSGKGAASVMACMPVSAGSYQETPHACGNGGMVARGDAHTARPY